jgi:hypothetical protein
MLTESGLAARENLSVPTLEEEMLSQASAEFVPVVLRQYILYGAPMPHRHSREQQLEVRLVSP